LPVSHIVKRGKNPRIGVTNDNITTE